MRENGMFYKCGITLFGVLLLAGLWHYDQSAMAVESIRSAKLELISNQEEVPNAEETPSPEGTPSPEETPSPEGTPDPEEEQGPTPEPGATVTIAPAKPLPKELSGDWKRDFLAIALSQEGYVQNEYNQTVYSEWANQSGRAWCSEFASWCADQAGIPKAYYPMNTSAKMNRRVFAEQKRFYLLEGGCIHDTCGCADIAYKLITVDELEPGDVILVETHDTPEDGPDHTGIVREVKDGVIYTIEGNSGGAVKKRTRKPEVIHGVCRPNFEAQYQTPPPSSLSIKAENTSKGIRISWKAYPGVLQYQIFRKIEGEAVSTKITTTTKTSYTDYNIKEGIRYRYFMKACVKDRSGKWIASEASAGKYMMFLQTTTLKAKKCKVIKGAKTAKVKLSWKKNSKAKGYYIRYSLQKNGKNSKKISISSNTKCKYTLAKLKKGKIYYLWISCYKKKGNSSYESVQSKRVKLRA